MPIKDIHEHIVFLDLPNKQRELHLKILYVIDKLPCPVYAGVHIRILHIGKQLAKSHEVQTVYVSPKGKFDKKRYQASCKELGDIIRFDIDCPKRNTLKGELYHKFWQHWPWKLAQSVSKNEQKRFESIADNYDIIWYETLIPAARFNYYGSQKAIVDLDDLNHIKIGLLNNQEKSAKQKFANNCMIKKWQKAESEAITTFAGIGLCSDADENYLSKQFQAKKGKIHIIPNGFEDVDSRIRDGKTQDCIQLGFIGVLSYGPNFEGLEWFIDNVWPRILEKSPDIKLRIVGKLPGNKDMPQGNNIEYAGFVDDVSDEFASWTAMIVPLLSGGGTRLKILESFARGCPVISTSTGAYGLKVSEKNIIICDNPEEFADKTLQLVQDGQKQKQLSIAGRETFEENYTWDIVGKKVNEILAKTIR